jgi:hypothetical protein
MTDKGTFGRLKRPPGKWGLRLLRKATAVLLSLALVIGVLPLSASAGQKEDAQQAILDFVQLYPQRINDYLERHEDNLDYNNFAAYLLSTYSGATHPNITPDFGSGVAGAIGALATGYTLVDEETRRMIDSTLTGLVSKVAAKSPSAQPFIEAVLKTILDKEAEVPKEGDIYTRLNALWGVTNAENSKYINSIAKIIAELKYSYAANYKQKGPTNYPNYWTFSDTPPALGSVYGKGGGINLNAAVEAISDVDFSAYTAFLNGDASAISGLLMQLSDDLTTLEPAFAVLDALGTIKSNDVSILSMILHADAASANDVPAWNTAEIVVEVIVDGVLADKDPVLANFAREYFDGVNSIDDLSAAAANLAQTIEDISSGDATKIKAALFEILAQLGILVVDSSGITDIDVGKAFDLLGIKEDDVKDALTGLFSETLDELSKLAALLKNDQLDLKELEKQANIIIGGLQREIGEALAILPDAAWANAIKAEVQKVSDALPVLLPLAKVVVKDLLDKAHTENYEWLEQHAGEALNVLLSGDASALAGYDLAGYGLSGYEEEIETAVKILGFIHKELKERGIDFTDFSENNKPIGTLKTLINTYLGYNVDTARAGIAEKIPTVLGLLNEHFDWTPDDIAGFIADAAQEYLTSNGLSAFAGVVDKDLVSDLVFSDDKTNLSDTGLTLVASAYVKAAGYVNSAIAAKSAEVKDLWSAAESVYNNAAYVACFVDSNKHVTITAEVASPAPAIGGVYATLANDYDALLYGGPSGNTEASQKGYAAFLKNLGFTFEYVISDSEYPFTIDGNKIVGDGEIPGTTYPLPIQARAYFDYNAHHYWFTFADKEVTIAVPALVNAETPVITTDLRDATPYVDEAVTLSVTVTPVTDGGTLSYQWYSNTTGTADPAADAAVGTDSNEYTPSTATTGTTYYYVVVTNENPAVDGLTTARATSSVATVTVVPTPSYTIELSDGAAPVGADYTFPNAEEGYGAQTPLEVTVTNTGNQDTGVLGITLSDADAFSLSKTTINSLTTTGAISGDLSDTFTVTPESNLAPGTYSATVTVTGANVTATFDISFTVTAAPPSTPVDAATPVIGTEPTGATYTQGNTATALTVAATVSDGGSLTYQWFSNTSNSNTGGTAISGATSASYTPSTAAAGTTYYYVVVTNTNNAVTGVKITIATSNAVAVTVNGGTGIGTGTGGGGGTPAAVVEEDIADEESPLATIEDDATPLAGFITERVAYINGYPDGTVKPDGGVTRAEIASMLLRLLSDEAKDDPIASTFTDVEDGQWYSQAIAYLASTGIVTGYEDGSFKPNAQITRAEFAAILSRFDESEAAAGEAERFSDVKTSYWAFAYIDKAAENGWLNGYPDGTFKPQTAITRAEAVTAINNLLARALTAADIPADAPVYTDLSENHWAYVDIIEATYDWVSAAPAEDADADADAEAEDADTATDADADAETDAESDTKTETTGK